MDDAARIDTAKRYLRRTYNTTNLEQLKALATDVWNCATDAVTLTGQSFDGGSSQGQITFEKLAYLTAIEDVIAELDTSTSAHPPSADRAYARFGFVSSVFPSGADASAGNTSSSS